MSHIHDKIDFTVEVFVVYKNRVLLRTHDKYNIWLGVGGHIELNEDPNQAAIREVKEEVGLDITLDASLLPYHRESEVYSELIPPYFLNRHRINPTHEHITLTYFAYAVTDNILELSEGEKSSEWQWFTKEEIEEKSDLLKDVAYYALKALEKLAS